MNPTPEIIAATLRLPVEARRKLLFSEPGWWAYPDGNLSRCFDFPSHNAGPDVVRRLEGGWAWLPANDTAWMVAACPAGLIPAWWLYSDTHEPWQFIGETGEPVIDAKTAQECALLAWGVL